MQLNDISATTPQGHYSAFLKLGITGDKVVEFVVRRCVMSQSSQKRDVIWPHAMNFIIAGKGWVSHAPVVCFSDDVMRKRNVYTSIRERSSRNM